MEQKIVITGMAVISPYGNGVDAIFEGMAQNRPAYGPLTGFDCSTLPIKVGGFIPEDRVNLAGLPHNKLRGMGKYVKLGVMAAREAVTNAGLDLTTIPAERIGAFITSGTFGHNAEGLFAAFDVSRGPENELNLAALGKDGIDYVHPWWLLSTISNNLIFFVTHFLGIKGMNTNTCNSSVGGAYALDQALESLRRDEVDVALIGGADCPLNWQILSDLSLFHFLAEGKPEDVMPLKPYRKNAAGTILSDAAVFFVCEKAGHAKKRGVSGLVEVAGVAAGGAFTDPILPAADGRETAKILGRLLKNIPASEIVQVNATSMGIPAWDQAEARGIRTAMDGHSLKIGSAKPWLGHTFSVSFLLETLVSAEALRRRIGLSFPETPEPSEIPDEILVQKGPLRHSWGINLGQCFGGNTGGVLLHVLSD